MVEKPDSTDILPYESEALIAALQCFGQNFGPEATASIYYPGPDMDQSPSVAFPKSKIIYLDINPVSIAALQKRGLNAHVGSAEEFNPGQVDLLLLLNFNGKKPLEFVKEGGFVLANNWWHAARDLRANPLFEALGALSQNQQTGQWFLDRENLKDYWTKVETDEEFKTADPYGFEIVVGDVNKYYEGNITSVVEAYKQLLDQAPEASGHKAAPDGTIYWGIPTKKGADYFVYRKKAIPTSESLL